MFDDGDDGGVEYPRIARAAAAGGRWWASVGVRVVLAVLALLVAYGLAGAQSGPFAPSGNPVSNQGYASAAITPNDSANLPQAPTRAIYNGAAASCAIAMKLNGDTVAVTFGNVPSGMILPVQAMRILATGTTCSGLVALY